MKTLRISIWMLFIATAMLNAAYSGVLFANDMPLFGVLSAFTAVLAVAAAILLHLFANAYMDELDRLADANAGLERLARQVEQRRRRDSGPDYN